MKAFRFSAWFEDGRFATGETRTVVVIHDDRKEAERLALTAWGRVPTSHSTVVEFPLESGTIIPSLTTEDLGRCAIR